MNMEPSAGYTGYLIQFLSSEKIDVVACFGNEGPQETAIVAWLGAAHISYK